MRKLFIRELGRKTVEEFRMSDKLPVILVLENIRSLFNVGVVFRSADAFAVEAMWLCGFTPVPPHRSIEKTALGATRSVVWKQYKDTLEAIKLLKEKKYRVIGVEQAEGSCSLNDFKPEKGRGYAFVFGNEVKGISQETIDQCDGCIEIPQFGTKHSLNVAVTASIVLWDLSVKFDKWISL